MLYRDAAKGLQRAGLLGNRAHALLRRCPRRRHQPRQGRRRRKFWIIRCADYERIAVEAAAHRVEGALTSTELDECRACNGSGVAGSVDFETGQFVSKTCAHCQGTGEASLRLY